MVYNGCRRTDRVQLRWGSRATSGHCFYQNDRCLGQPTQLWTRLFERWRQQRDSQFRTERHNVGRLAQSSNGPQVQPLTARPCLRTSPSISAQRGLRQFAVPNNLLQGLDSARTVTPAAPCSRIFLDLERRTHLPGFTRIGQSFAIARVAVAQFFAAPDMLKSRDGGTFEQTIDSGEPTFSPEGARIIGGAGGSSRTLILPRNSAR